MRSYSPRPAAVGIDTSRPAKERYRIVGRIAAGGMAEIYLARMLTRAGQWREVVLKRLLPDLQADQEFVQMFYDEARIASQLKHPNVVEIFELGELDGSLFIAMEHVRGVNLQDLRRQITAKGTKIPISLALKIGCDALSALAYAHDFADSSGQRLKVVHRDVSPQNILVTFGGDVKLVDFGVARAEGRLHETKVGFVKGKYAYMAPEQIMGEPVDARADLFALAEVIYELLLSRHPFDSANDAHLLQLVLECRPPSPQSIDPTLAGPLTGILLRALDRNPENRYPDAASMREALISFASDRARFPTGAQLARFVSNAFGARLGLEKRARESGDDAMLLRAWKVGAEGRAALATPAGLRPENDEELPPVVDEAPLGFDKDPTIGEEEPGALQDISKSLARFDPSEDFSVEPTLVEGDLNSPAGLKQLSMPGSRFGEYTLVRRIGLGSMAEVFLARQRGAYGFEKMIALKRVLPHLVTEKRFVRMFLREARLASRLTHPHIVQILDLGIAEGQYYLAMELIDGWDLATVLSQCRLRQEEVPINFACRIMSDVVGALLAAHSAVDERGSPLRIIHRDVAPQNLLLSAQGIVKLTDFGIAKAAGSEAFSQRGELRGKPSYMAPECLLSPGVDPSRPDSFAPGLGRADERTDIFSAGAVLFEMLTLRPLFSGATAFETILSVQRDPIPTATAFRKDVPAGLEAIVQRAIARAPQDRYPTAEPFQVDLERLLARLGKPVTPSQIATWLAQLFATKGTTDDLLTDASFDSPPSIDTVATHIADLEPPPATRPRRK